MAIWNRRRQSAPRAESEQDLRLDILNTLLTTPHRKLEDIWPVHFELAERDPLFYVRLAAWYADHGDVRDHKEMFVIRLILSSFEGHRDTGLALLRKLPPYELVRVVDFISGRKKTRKVRAAPQGAAPRAQRSRAVPGQPPAPTEVRTVVEDFGLFRNPPRALKTEVIRYLREREADPVWFDSTVLVARKAVKRLYALLHVAPGERAQKILFDEDPPADSRLFALKQLGQASSPAEQARAIIEHEIPYRVAATVVGQLTPTVLYALVERMSPQELINNLASLKRRGGLDNPEIKSLVDQKLEQAKSAQRVSAFKTSEALKAADLGDEMRAQLEEVADTQVKAKGRISRPTALLIDKSSSMEQSIEIGKRLGAMVSAICEKELYVYAFDTIAYLVQRAGDDLASWEKALAGIRAGGSTSCGVALEYMLRKGEYVEQIVVITDEEENTPPLFVNTLLKYREQMKTDPSVCLVRTTGGQNLLERQCREAGIEANVFQFSGDYYSLPNLVPMLARPSKLELLMEIMEYPLPERLPS